MCLQNFILRYWLKFDSEGAVTFNSDADPGEGQLRVVGHVLKMKLVFDKHGVTFREAHEVIFGKGRSTFLEEKLVPKEIEGASILERQFKIVGLTVSGKPIVVVITPRDEFGTAKRIVTAWQVSRKSKEVRKLLKDCPHLKVS